MSAIKRQGERLIVLLLIGVLALNYPLLALFSKSVLWLGIPVLYLYLFLFWALFIGLLAVVMEKREPPKSEIDRSESGETD
jgi:peptidoglycan/LPS O-acetylase OafA/YrhL